MCDRGPAGAHRRHEVDVDRALPRLVVVTLARAARVVDQRVDLAQRLRHVVDERLDLARLRHVDDAGVDFDAGGFELGLGLA